MIKKYMAVVMLATVSVIAGIGVALAERGVGLTPDQEFTTLAEQRMTPDFPASTAAPVPSEQATMPISNSHGATEVHPADSNSTPVVATPSSMGTSNLPPSISVAAGPETPRAEVGATPGTNTSADIGSDVVPVTQFTSSGSKENLISVALDDVPLQDVVRLFTKISGANIIASSTNLQGKVTVSLQDVEWKPALDSILDMYSMSVVEKVPGSGIYSVMPKAPGSAEPLIAQPIFLNNAQVSNVVAVIKPMVGPEGMVSPFPNANAIVVRASAANLNAIRKVIQEIDLPRQQVYIEAKFLELTDEAIKDLGVNWQVLEGYSVGASTLSQTLNDSRDKFNGKRDGLGTVDSVLRNDAASVSGSGLPGSGATESRTSSDTIKSGNSSAISDSTKDGLVSTVGSTGSRDASDSITRSANYSHESERIRGQHLTDVRTAVLSADDFKLVLSALQQVNGISIVSNPKIIVANEETATIHIGENEPNIKGTVTPGQQGQANTTTYALDEKKPYFEFGISVDVTPTINNLSNVTVRIEPKLSRYVRDKVAPDNNSYPVESTKTIKTTFSLESGKTAAIGGLTETDLRDAVVKVPLLGDIPLLGKYLFTHTHKQRTQTETIIFVTVGLVNPKTVESEAGLPEETTLARQHMEAKRLQAAEMAKSGKNNKPKSSLQILNDR